MSTVANPVLELPAVAPIAPAAPLPLEPVTVHVPIMIDGEVLIPGWVVDQESFRRWAHSEEFPQTGRYSFLDGMLWVDRTMEEIFSHNQVKTRYSRVLDQLVCDAKSGYFLSDGCLWSNPEAGISTVADSLFVSYEAVKSGRVRLIDGAKRGYMEVEGTPDMTLEIVSDSSVKKDTQVLKEKCAKAGVAEYWLVDARGTEPNFQIWQLREGEYHLAANDNGWLTSLVFGKAFKLEKSEDPLGHPAYQLLMR